jgi:hypothetical protein
MNALILIAQNILETLNTVADKEVKDQLKS